MKKTDASAPSDQDWVRLSGESPDGLVAWVGRRGAALERMTVVGPDGLRRDVVLGLRDRRVDPYHVGGVVGRCANRIAGARFRLDGRTVSVDANEGPHSLHGGADGFDRRDWRILERAEHSVTLELESPDGDQGFPGAVRVRARYTCTRDALQLELTATTDSPTFLNLTHHAYFNLDGVGSRTVDDHTLRVPASFFTPTSSDGVPTGEVRRLAGSCLDLAEARRVGTVLGQGCECLRARDGLDHNYIPDGVGLRIVAEARGASGTHLRLWSDAPGLQVYSGQCLDAASIERDGSAHFARGGFALEPQYFPDSPNQVGFPDTTLRPGQVRRTQIRWDFSDRS